MPSMYRRVSDNDLQLYLEFAESEAGHSYYAALVDVCGGAMYDASQAFGRQIMETAGDR